MASHLETTPALLCLSVLLLASFGPCSAVDSVPVAIDFSSFKAWPQPDYCGYPFFDGTYGGSGQSCPFDICKPQRQACKAAEDRIRACKSGNPPCTAKDYTNATAVCDMSAACVKKACSSSSPWNAHGQSCQVRTYRGGECCCPSCHGAADTGRFTCKKPGQNSQATAWLTLEAFTRAVFNDQEDLSSFIQGAKGAAVYSIKLDWVKGEDFLYKLTVDGNGPAGGGALYLAFYDKSGGYHVMAIDSPTRKIFTLGYDAIKSGITTIVWANYPL